MKYFTRSTLLRWPTGALTFMYLLISLPVWADSLQSIGTDRQKAMAALAEISDRESYLKDRISRTEEDLQAANQALAEHEKKLAEAIEKAETEPGDISARAATHASIRYNRSQARSQRLQERLDKAQQELKALDDERAQLNQQLASLHKREQQLKAQAAKPTPKPKPAPIAVSEPAVVATAAAKPTPMAGWPKGPEDETAANIAYAKARLDAATSKPAGEPPLPAVKVNHNRGRSTETMTYIGDNYYVLNQRLAPGMWGFKIFNQTYWVSIPQALANQEFRLIYDVNGKAQLHVIRAAALE